MKDKELPIGYWIKRADQLLTEGADVVQSTFGLNRTSWMLVNSLAEKEWMSVDDCLKLLTPFTEKEQFDKLLEGLSARNVIEQKSDHLSLTNEGSDLHRKCLVAQQAFRSKTMDGISQEQYTMAVSTLKRLVSNLDATGKAEHTTNE